MPKLRMEIESFAEEAKELAAKVRARVDVDVFRGVGV